MHKYLTGLDAHDEQQYRSNDKLDDPLLSSTLKVLTTIAIVLAAIVIAILVDVLQVY